MNNLDVMAILATADDREDVECLWLPNCRVYYPGGMGISNPSYWFIPTFGTARPFPDFAGAMDFAASYERMCQHG